MCWCMCSESYFQEESDQLTLLELHVLTSKKGKAELFSKGLKFKWSVAFKRLARRRVYYIAETTGCQVAGDVSVLIW